MPTPDLGDLILLSLCFLDSADFTPLEHSGRLTTQRPGREGQGLGRQEGLSHAQSASSCETVGSAHLFSEPEIPSLLPPIFGASHAAHSSHRL